LSPLARRLLVAAWGIPLLIGVTVFGRWPFRLLVLAIGILAASEAFRLLAPHASKRLLWPVWALAAGMMLFVDPQQTDRLVWFYAAFGLMLAIAMLRTEPGQGNKAWMAAASLFVYPLFLLVHLVWLRDQHGWEIVLYLLALLWVGDTAAYAGGRMMGRHRLAPALSPNKTLEGAAWALVFSLAVGAAAFGLARPCPHGLLWYLVTSATVWLLGMLGDLFESLLKRSAGVKDSSQLLSEHGGVLDRFDSLLFAVVPLYYLAFWQV
jgi:phosphatidate cytidylyltransferase